MNNTKQNNNNAENENSLFEERQDVTCSEGEAVTELSQSSGSPISFKSGGHRKEYGDDLDSFLFYFLDLPFAIREIFFEKTQGFIDLVRIENEITEGTLVLVLKPSDLLLDLASAARAGILEKRIIELDFHNFDCGERQDVTCSEGEAVTELSPSSGSPFWDTECWTPDGIDSHIALRLKHLCFDVKNGDISDEEFDKRLDIIAASPHMSETIGIFCKVLKFVKLGNEKDLHSFILR